MIEKILLKLERDVLAFLADTGMKRSRFGLESVGDKSFVTRLENDERDFTASTIDKVYAYMAHKAAE